MFYKLVHWYKDYSWCFYLQGYIWYNFMTYVCQEFSLLLLYQVQECMARVIWARFQITTWQLTFYDALRYSHEWWVAMWTFLAGEIKWYLFNGVHLCDHWIQINIEKCPFTYWLNGRWFLQIVESDSWNIYPLYPLFPCSGVSQNGGGGGCNVFLTFYDIYQNL